MESGREGCARESAPPTLAERVDEAIAAAERTLGAAVECVGAPHARKRGPFKADVAWGPRSRGALPETPVEAIATRQGRPRSRGE